MGGAIGGVAPDPTVVQSQNLTLQNLLGQNREKVESIRPDYEAHVAFVKTMNEPGCNERFSEYISFVNTLPMMLNFTYDTSRFVGKYNLDEQKAAYAECLKNPPAATRQPLRYYEVCGKDKGKSGGREFCVEDFSSVQVRLLQAAGLTKEYANIKNSHTIECSSDIRGINKLNPLNPRDDYIKCVSTDGKNFYEFLFDDIKESFDSTIQNGVQSGVCAIHNEKYTTRGYSAGGSPTVGGSTASTSWDASCTGNQTKCNAIDKSLQIFGYNAEFRNNICNVVFNGVNDRNELKTAYNINNFAFCNNIQIQGSDQVVNYLRQYVVRMAGTTINSFNCDASTRTYRGTGCRVNGITDIKDDVLRCYANGNPIDFVFDDFNEAIGFTARGGMSGMACISGDGMYDGKKCWGLDVAQCAKMDEILKKEVPESRGTEWSTEYNTCVLRDATRASTIDKTVRIVANVSLVAGTTIATLPLGGSGGVATAYAIIAVEATGLAVTEYARHQASGAGTEFLAESTQCKSSACAETILSEQLRRVSNLQKNFEPAQIDVIDIELERLIKLLPNDSDVYKNTLADNRLKLTNPDAWEKEEVLMVVGTVMQFASVFHAAFRLGARGLDKAREALFRGAQRAARELPRTEVSIIRGTANVIDNIMNTESAAEIFLNSADNLRLGI